VNKERSNNPNVEEWKSGSTKTSYQRSGFSNQGMERNGSRNDLDLRAKDGRMFQALFTRFFKAVTF
jgi:hypothetical protein